MEALKESISPDSTAASFMATRISTGFEGSLKQSENKKLPPMSPARQSMIKESILRRETAEHEKAVDEI